MIPNSTPPTPAPMPANVSGLFQSVQNQQQQASNYLNKGRLITFNYSRWIHDPYPLLILTDVIPNVRIRGINLHYLTFPFVKTMLQTGCTSPQFSYQNVKGNPYIVGAFRSYKWQAIRQVRYLDCQFILAVMATVRSFDPSQVQAIRRAVQEQIQQYSQPNVTQLQGQNVQNQNMGPQNMGPEIPTQ